MDTILDLIIDDKRKDYKCFDLLKHYYKTDNDFASFINEGVRSGKIIGFDEDLWNKISDLNSRTKLSFEEAFMHGLNEGGCTTFSKYLSFCFNKVMICGGTLPILKGTKNSPDGRHTWIVNNKQIYDTSLMLIMDEEYAIRGLNYDEENRYDPSNDSIYRASKEFATDVNLRR